MCHIPYLVVFPPLWPQDKAFAGWSDITITACKMQVLILFIFGKQVFEPVGYFAHAACLMLSTMGGL